jgi:hypothetical protein
MWILRMWVVGVLARLLSCHDGIVDLTRKTYTTVT